MQRFPNANFGLGTFVVNVSGSFLIGLLVGLLVERFRLSPYWHLTAVVGFLGGYTTFSSFEYEAFLSVRGGHPLAAFTYLASNVVCGYAALWLGSLLALRV